MNQPVQSAIQAVLSLAKCCADNRWFPATSGNISVQITANPLLFAITRSGVDKQSLQETDILLVDDNMKVHNSDIYKPSAETAVHIQLYQRQLCNSIVHVHTIYNNLISELYGPAGNVKLENQELLKGLGHWEKQAQIEVPIVENHADIPQLAEAVSAVASPDVPGILVRNHGIYAFGNSPFEAKRHLEAFEFLFEYHVRLQMLRN